MAEPSFYRSFTIYYLFNQLFFGNSTIVNQIILRGVRTHNLKNIDLAIPRNQLVVITGVSGSGKSSLAFDTLYAEGQRRYVESLSAYARQFLSVMEKPDIDHIEGLSPAIAIQQKATSHNPRSTVGTTTEIYDYLRLLFARIGTPICPLHQQSLEAKTISQMVDQLITLPDNEPLMILAPVIRDKKGEHIHLIEDLKKKGFIRARIDGLVVDLDSVPPLDKYKKHNIEVVIDRIKVKKEANQRLADSLEIALSLTQGLVMICFLNDPDRSPMIFSSKFSCTECGYSLNELEPRLFSFNNPAGACQACDGLGLKQMFEIEHIVSSPALSLAEGAIRSWDRRHVWYYQMLVSLAEHYEIDIDQPFEQLPDDFKHILFYGSGDEKIQFCYHANDSKKVTKKQRFEGIIPNFERRYRETDLAYLREELSNYMVTKACPACEGSRLCEAARFVFVNEVNLPFLVSLSIEKAFEYVASIKLTGYKGEVADPILKEISVRLNFLINVGLNYLTLNRGADTLSGGESQRIRLASQIGSGLTGVMYVLDEPSIGLHQRDNDRLLQTLFRLRDLGNTVIVVEHDEDTIRHADFIVDVGPQSGIHGGEIVAAGTLKDILNTPQSLTGQYLLGKKSIDVPSARLKPQADKQLVLTGCRGHNLNNVTLKLPLGLMTCITGVSGSGKSTLINRTLYPLLASKLNRVKTLKIADHDDITGLEWVDKCIAINQNPIGRTPHSNPSTYIGLFTVIRELFAGTEEARLRGYKIGRFSFNVKGGRCEACRGEGVIKVEMHFLADIYVDCDVCHSQRYNRETLEIKYKHKTIADVLAMTVEEAIMFFDAIPAIKRKLKVLMEVGLSYLRLGQNAITLSGGEAQRIKLAKELSKQSTGKTIYVLDEPTTGLHFDDIKQLLGFLIKLREEGNTVVVIEHNLDVIKLADWVIDLGPEGGCGGGDVIAEGTPEQVAQSSCSYTGQFLKKIL